MGVDVKERVSMCARIGLGSHTSVCGCAKVRLCMRECVGVGA